MPGDTAVGHNLDRRDDGTWSRGFDDEEFLDAISEPGIGTAKVAEEVGCKRNTAYKRLKQLEDDGLVEGEPVGNSLIWRPANEEEG